MKQLWQDFCNFFIKNRRWIIVLLIITLLCFGFELTNFTLSIDEEYSILNGIDISGWLSQSRYTTGFIKLLMNSTKVVPYWSTFLCVNMLFLASIFWTFVVNQCLVKKNHWSLAIFAALIISSPINVFFVSFSTYNFEVALGILLTGVAVYFANQFFLKKTSYKNCLLSLIILTFCLGIYQSFIILFSFGCAFCWLLDLTQTNKSIKFQEFCVSLLKLTTIVFASLACYFLINKCIQIFVPPSSYLVDNFWQWPHKTISQFINEMREFFYDIIYNYQFLFGKIWCLTVFSSLPIFFSLFKKNTKWLTFPLLTFIVISPLVMSVLLGFNMPLRTNQTIAYSIACIWFLLVISIKNKQVQTIITIIALFICLMQTKEINQFFYTDHLRYQRDIELANQINNRLEELDYNHHQPIYFVGTHKNNIDFRKFQYESVGYSFFEYDNGNNFRIRAFLETRGYKWELIPKDQWPQAEAFATNLPIWPAEESIQATNSGIIIKLSESTYVPEN